MSGQKFNKKRVSSRLAFVYRLSLVSCPLATGRIHFMPPLGTHFHIVLVLQCLTQESAFIVSRLGTHSRFTVL